MEAATGFAVAGFAALGLRGPDRIGRLDLAAISGSPRHGDGFRHRKTRIYRQRLDHRRFCALYSGEEGITPCRRCHFIGRLRYGITGQGLGPFAALDDGMNRRLFMKPA